LLHNIFTDRRIFDDAAAELGRHGFRTVAVDFRGHGASATSGVARYAITDLVGDVLAVLDREDIGRTAIAGVSLGASVALELALARPERVESLMLMGVDAEPDGGFAAFRNALFCRLVGLVGMRWFVLGGVVATIFGAWFRTEGGERFSAWRARLAGMPPGLARRAMQAWTGRRSLLGALPRLRVKAQVIVGDEDVSCPLPCGQKVQQGLPGAELVRLPRAGHTMPAERPAEVAAALLAFLGAHGAEAASLTGRAPGRA
jgi:pimeloyl-ACP methyl ester carboxylesterase